MKRLFAIALLGSITLVTPWAADETPEKVPYQHDKPIIERDGRRLLWAGETEAGEPLWFDMTDSPVDPVRFQHGIGRDVIPSIDNPEFVLPTDARLLERGVHGATPVLGVSINGIARAYPVAVLDDHEVVNDRFGEQAFAVLW